MSVVPVAEPPVPPPPVPQLPPPPPSPSVHTVPKRHDEFYKYWDHFIYEGPTAKNSKKKRRDAAHNGTISLDADVEGRPTYVTRRNSQGTVTTQGATISYEEAVATCRAKVRAIVNECARLNVKYTDRNFFGPDSLVSLGKENQQDMPHSVKNIRGARGFKRVADIFETPQFFVDGATASDIRQGRVGDCWFLAAVAALSGKKDLILKICVDRDENAGVYGFVFFRDGEWISTVVDDRLALRAPDDRTQDSKEYLLSVLGDADVYREGLHSNMKLGEHYDISRLPKIIQESRRKGSNALYFASCRESNETWLPLLEKAYAKVHGDYQAIEGGFVGEGIEDMTGGVSTFITSETVLDKDKLWSELLQVNQDSGFLFGCLSRYGGNSGPYDEKGFVLDHAYTVMSARELKDPEDDAKTFRLLKIRNPWGKGEWNGPWSDGSKEWSAKMMIELDHKFGDDGIFWISFQDWLKYFPEFERTKLFGPEWTVSQQWTSANVPWRAEYLDGVFSFVLAQMSPVVIVLSQPDDRYFRGLEGRHLFKLHFRLYREGEKTYIVRSMLGTGSGRSCSAELELEAGKYSVHVKIETSRSFIWSTADEAIKMYRNERRDKLLEVGHNFDLSHSKGRLREREEKNEKDRKAAARKRDRGELKRRRMCSRIERKRERARNLRLEAGQRRKLEDKKAERKKERAEKKAPKTEAGAVNTGALKAVVVEVDVEGVKTDQQPVSPPDSSADAPTKESLPQRIRAADPSEAPRDDAASELRGKVDDQDKTSTPGAATDPKNESEAGDKDEGRAYIEENDGAGDDDDLSVSDVSFMQDSDFSWDSEIDGPADIDSETDEEPGMFTDDPWNATCVLGLRVYSMDKNLSIRVEEDEECA